MQGRLTDVFAILDGMQRTHFQKKKKTTLANVFEGVQIFPKFDKYTRAKDVSTERFYRLFDNTIAHEIVRSLFSKKTISDMQICGSNCSKRFVITTEILKR